MDDISIYEAFAKRLRRTRRSRDLPQWRLSEISGVPQASISRYEQNRNPVSNVQHIACLAGALHVSVDYLLGLSDEESPR